MAEDHSYSSRSDHKRKYDDPDHAAAPPVRRGTGFSGPITSLSLDKDSGAPPAPSYNNVPPPPDEIEIAKQRAQEIAARLFSDAEAKRPRLENGGGLDDNRGFRSVGFDQKALGQTVPSHTGISQSFSTYGYQGSNKRIDVPNGRVGVIIGKGGETIKYLQLQSGAKIQVTRDMDAGPNSQTRTVELMGTSEQISKAEQLINDVLAQAEAGASNNIASRNLGGVQVGVEQFQMNIANNKVGLVIGKGGETIKSMQAKSGARIQVIPLHLPPGDTSTERTVYIDGIKEQVEAAKQLVIEVTSEFCTWERIDGHHQCSMRPNRVRNPAMVGGYPQQGYRPPQPPTTWGLPGVPPMQQPGYGYVQPGSYPGAPLPQYNIYQPPYGSYPPPASSGFQSGWDQSSTMPTQQPTPGTGYDYYSQQQQPQQPQAIGGSSAPADNNSYNYGQLPTYSSQGSYGDSTYGQQAGGGHQGYAADSSYSGGYYAPGPQQGYDQRGYGAAQDGSVPNYGAPSGTNQVSPSQQTSGSHQGHTAQGTPPSGYGLLPVPQSGYGSQPPAQAGYGQPPASQGGYDSSHQPPTPGFAPGGLQAGYGQQQAYTGGPPTGHAGYGQQQQPPAYSHDNAGAAAPAPGGNKTSPN